MSTTGYVYDQGWSEERARLAGMEALWDPGSQALLQGVGLGRDWRVWEVGAGGGALVEWLGARAGSVLATDIDTRFVEPLASRTVEVRRHDVVADRPPAEGGFDLVHIRLVLEHLPERETALDNLVATLRPGGWLVVEDLDWTPFGFDPEDEGDRRAAEGVMDFMSKAGFQRDYGRRAVSALLDRGLVEVRGEGRQLAIDATHPGFAFFALSIQQLAPAAVQAGTLSEELATRTATRMSEPGRRVLTPVLMAAIGRKPDEGERA